MEARKITIIESKSQKKSVIMSAATTLGELKSDLRDNNIDYSDMTFFEGLSKTELKTDESVLPHDVPHKGTTTNELVFMLTNPNKKIRSGTMTRTEAYDYIRSHNLQEEVLKRFGKNFTMCKTVDLISVIEDNKCDSCECRVTPSTEVTEGTVDTVARKVIEKLVDILYYADYISNKEKGLILDTLHGETTGKEDTTKSPYSDEEIDKMFDGML